MIQVAQLSVKHEAVGSPSLELGDEIRVAGTREGGDGIFLRIGVEVTDYQEVGIATAGWIRRQISGQGRGGRRSGPRTVRLAVVQAGIPDVVTR